MSYARGQTHSGRIRVGANAGEDVILAQASYDASKLLLASSRLARVQRQTFIRRELRRFGPGSWQRFQRERDVLLGRGWEPNQALFDALRLVASNYYAEKGMAAIRAAMADEFGADVGLGIDDTGRAVGCGITGGVTMIGGLIASIYGGQAGGGAVGAGGSAVAGALDCSKEQRESQEKIAQSQAQAAQAMANAALAQAQAQERSQATLARERTKQIQTVAIAGGGLLLLFTVGYLILKV